MCGCLCIYTGVCIQIGTSKSVIQKMKTQSLKTLGWNSVWWSVGNSVHFPMYRSARMSAKDSAWWFVYNYFANSVVSWAVNDFVKNEKTKT